MSVLGTQGTEQAQHAAQEAERQLLDLTGKLLMTAWALGKGAWDKMFNKEKDKDQEPMQKMSLKEALEGLHGSAQAKDAQSARTYKAYIDKMTQDYFKNQPESIQKQYENKSLSERIKYMVQKDGRNVYSGITIDVPSKAVPEKHQYYLGISSQKRQQIFSQIRQNKERTQPQNAVQAQTIQRKNTQRTRKPSRSLQIGGR